MTESFEQLHVQACATLETLHKQTSVTIETNNNLIAKKQQQG